LTRLHVSTFWCRYSL